MTKRFLNSDQTVDIYNVGSADTITVKEIAKIVASATHHPEIALSAPEELTVEEAGRAT